MKSPKDIFIFFQKWKTEVVIWWSYLFLPFLFFLESPFSKSILGKYDSFFYTLPTKLFNVQSILNGELPFWNPYNLCGTPFITDIEAGFFYPPNWIFFLFKPEIAHNLNILFHYQMAGFFTFLYLRSLKCRVRPSFLGGIAFMFCGPMIGHVEHVNMLQSAAWLPLMMLILEKICEIDHGPRYGWMGLGALVYSAQILAGHLQIPFLTAILIFFRVLWLCIACKVNRMAMIRSVSITILLALGLSAIQWVPGYIYHLQTLRSHMTFGFFTENSFPPLACILFFFPYYYGAHDVSFYHVAYWGDRIGILNLIEYASYCGYMVYMFFLSTLFLSSQIKKKILWFFLFMTGLSFFLMLGEFNPLYKIIYHIPIFNVFRSPCRYNFLFSFSMIICAWIGFDYFLNHTEQIGVPKKSYLFVIGIFVTLLGIFIVLFGMPAWHAQAVSWLIDNTIYRQILKSQIASFTLHDTAIRLPFVFMALSILIMLMGLFVPLNKRLYRNLWCGAVIVILFSDLFGAGYALINKTPGNYFHPHQPGFLSKVVSDHNHRMLLERKPQMSQLDLVSSLTPNLNMLSHLRMASAEYYPFAMDHTRRMLNLHPYGDNGDCLGLLANNKILSAYAIKYILLHKDSPSFQMVDFISDNHIETSDKIQFADFQLKAPKDALAQKEFDGKAHEVELENRSIYELSFEARGDNSHEVFISVYSKTLQKNILIRSIQQLSLDWKIYQKTFITDPNGGNYIFNLYSKSYRPIYFKHLFIKKLPFRPANTQRKIHPYYKVIDSREENDMRLIENKKALSLVFCVDNVKRIDAFESFYRISRSIPNAWDPHQTAFIESDRIPGWKLGPSFEPPFIGQQGLNYMEIGSGGRDNRFLVFCDSFISGWQAWIDGKRTEIYKTNGIMKGIFVPSGFHKIVFQYYPPGFNGGVVITLIAILVLGIIFRLHFRPSATDSKLKTNSR